MLVKRAERHNITDNIFDTETTTQLNCESLCTVGLLLIVPPGWIVPVSLRAPRPTPRGGGRVSEGGMTLTRRPSPAVME